MHKNPGARGFCYGKIEKKLLMNLFQQNFIPKEAVASFCTCETKPREFCLIHASEDRIFYPPEDVDSEG
jgi:hypothetical protein